MNAYLSDEWHAAALSLASAYPVQVGVSARSNTKVTGGPNGDVSFHQEVVDGRIVAQGSGELPDADFSLQVTWEDSVAIASGALDANVAFMRGRLKVTGSMGPLMALQPLALSDAYRDAQVALRAQTEFSASE